MNDGNSFSFQRSGFEEMAIGFQRRAAHHHETIDAVTIKPPVDAVETHWLGIVAGPDLTAGRGEKTKPPRRWPPHLPSPPMHDGGGFFSSPAARPPAAARNR